MSVSVHDYIIIDFFIDCWHMGCSIIRQINEKENLKTKYSRMINKETGLRFIRINKTGEKIFEIDNPEEYERLRKLSIINLNRASQDDCMRSLGLTKVRGIVSGRVYWE